MTAARIAALGMALALPALAAAAPEAHIKTIEARLLLETSGRLSGNIAPPADFAGWNTIIGEPVSGEPANDVLVSVTMESADDEANLRAPLVVVVRGGDGKVLARRSFPSLYLKGHRAVRSLLVPDATCAGRVRIDATYGAQHKSAVLSLNCGE